MNTFDNVLLFILERETCTKKKKKEIGKRLMHILLTEITSFTYFVEWPCSRAYIPDKLSVTKMGELGPLGTRGYS